MTIKYYAVIKKYGIRWRVQVVEMYGTVALSANYGYRFTVKGAKKLAYKILDKSKHDQLEFIIEEKTDDR